MTGTRALGSGVARAVAALTGLAALLAGVPYALDRCTGSPVPRHLPRLAQARAFLASPLSDQAVIRLLADSAWLLWALFAAAVAAEAIAAARNRTALRLPLISPVQALAAALVSATILASAPAATTGRPGPPHAHAATTTAVLTAGRGGRQSTAALLAAYPVGTGTSPSASDGNGQQGRTYELYLVVPGDNLWDIAQSHLGSAERWTQIYELNKDRPQPGGQKLTHPRLLLPGWTLLIPVRSSPAASPAHRHPASAGRGRPAAPRSAPSPSASGASPASPAASPTTAAPSHAVSPSPSIPAEPHPRGGARLPSGEIIGYTLVTLAGGAAVTVARLALRRARQPWPVPGTAPAYPQDGPVVQAIRHAYLTGSADEEPDGALAAPAPRPPAAISASPSAERAAQSVPVAVRDGREVSLDLASAPGIAFTGPGSDAAIRAMIVAILAQRAREQPQVALCGAVAVRLLAGPDGQFPPGVPGLSAGRAASMLAALETELTRRRRVLEASGAATFDEYRAARPDEEMPVITVVAAGGPDTARLAGILRVGRHLGITAILSGPGPDGAACEVAADGRVLAAEGAARSLRGARMFQLPLTGAAEMLQTLAAAAGTIVAQPRPGAPERPLPSPTADSVSLSPDHSAELSVLGPFALAAGGGLIARGMRRKAAELLTYLAVHPDGATTQVLLEALWPGTAPDRSGPILHAATTNVRSLLRSATTTPESAFIVRVGDHLKIDTRLIGSDLQSFRAALAAAANAATDQDRAAALEEATRLWRGDLADGMDAVWIEEHRETLRRDATDAFARLAQLYEQDDPDKALAALDRAIAVDRYQEELYRRIMTLQGTLGRPDAARRTYQLLRSRLADLDAEPEDRTTRLLDQIVSESVQRQA